MPGSFWRHSSVSYHSVILPGARQRFQDSAFFGIFENSAAAVMGTPGVDPG